VWAEGWEWRRQETGRKEKEKAGGLKFPPLAQCAKREEVGAQRERTGAESPSGGGRWSIPWRIFREFSCDAFLSLCVHFVLAIAAGASGQSCAEGVVIGAFKA